MSGQFQKTEKELAVCIRIFESGEVPGGKESQAALRIFREVLQCMKDNAVIRDYDEDYLEDIVKHSTMEGS